jgi:hypothetical protein
VEKRNRIYELKIQLDTGTDVEEYKVIQLPFTIEFNIIRVYRTAKQDATIKIYNLNEQTRNLIRVDFNDPLKRRKMILKAGYEGDQMSIIFAGYIGNAFSYREGTNFITQITGGDGGYAWETAESNHTFGIGTSYKQIITALLNDLVNANGKKNVVQIGKISNRIFENTPNLQRQISLSGNTADLLRQFFANNGCFIDNNVINVIAENETIPSLVNEINAETGLLGTPIINAQKVFVDVIFEPRFLVAQRVYLRSSTGSQEILGVSINPKQYYFAMNSFYKIYDITHRGMISPTVNAPAITTLGMYAGIFQDI